MKYPGITLGKIEALINCLNGMEVVDKLCSGELTVSFKGSALEIIEALKKLFDKNGRRIPENLKAAVCDPNSGYFLKQPAIDYARSFSKGFEGTGLAANMAASDFEETAKQLIEGLKADERTKKLLKGVYLPIIIPQTEIADLGEAVEEFVGMAEKSYRKEFKKRNFTNHRKNDLKGKVTVVAGSRYEKLIEKMQKESVVGIYFPNPLQGFSVDAQREQMAALPEGFSLSGPIDTAMGFAMYPELLGKDATTPVYDCSAVQWQSSGYSLNFGADDDDADFGSGSNLSDADDYCSGGLLFVKG